MYDMNHYQLDALNSSTDGDDHHTAMYLLTGMTAELGEVASLFERERRKHEPFDTDDMESELGDVLWYLSALAANFGLSLNDIAETNLTKLTKRGKQ